MNFDALSAFSGCEFDTEILDKLPACCDRCVELDLARYC